MREIVFMCVCGGGKISIEGGDQGRKLKGKHYLAIVDIYIFGYNSEFYAAYKAQFVGRHLGNVNIFFKVLGLKFCNRGLKWY